MAATPVTPIPGINTNIVTGGSPVVVFNAGPNGGFIVNPASPADQNIGGGNVESLYVDATGADPIVGAFGTTFEIPPGGSWFVIAGQTTITKVVGQTSGHRFSAVSY